MRTNGPSCSDNSKEYRGMWTCPGPAGLAVTFFDEGNVVGVSFGRDVRKDRNAATAIWRGAGKVFGDLLEWRIDDRGIPRAAILRTWEVGETGESVQSLRVFSINDDIACEHASVAATLPHANWDAGAEAENASRWYCTEK
jgi:hypothetical protein